MATYANSINVLCDVAHCLPLSLPDKPVAGRPVTGRALLLGYLGTIPHGYGYQRGCEGLWCGLMLDGLQPIAKT